MNSKRIALLLVALLRGAPSRQRFEGFDSSLAYQAIFDVHLERPKAV